jgi:type I restriction enzyme, S subunit
MIPEGWKRKTLTCLGKWKGGGTPSKANLNYWENGSIPWVSPKDMKSNSIKETEDYITPEAIVESSTNLIPQGSILVVTRSGILRHSVPIAINEVPVSINQDLKALIPSNEFDVGYVANYMWLNDKNILFSGAYAAAIDGEEPI